jgi:hypothetical protein
MPDKNAPTLRTRMFVRLSEFRAYRRERVSEFNSSYTFYPIPSSIRTKIFSIEQPSFHTELNSLIH